MIEEITIKFGMELKPTQDSWKSQLYTMSKDTARIWKVRGAHHWVRENLQKNGAVNYIIHVARLSLLTIFLTREFFPFSFLTLPFF